MEIIARPRGMGKTRELINRLLESDSENNNPGIILTADISRRDYIRSWLPEKLQDYVVTYAQAQHGVLLGMRYDGIWIDDIEDYLTVTTNFNRVNGFTVSVLPAKEWDN